MKIFILIPAVITAAVFIIYWFELDTLALRKLEPWFRRRTRKLN